MIKAKIIILFLTPIGIVAVMIYLALQSPMYGPIYSSIGSIFMLYATVKCGESIEKQIKERKGNGNNERSR